MSSTVHDPRLLYSVDNIRAYHLQNGEQSDLTPSGPQTLSLLMVPTSAGFSEPPNPSATVEPPEMDFYLHLHLPPELDMPLPATTQIYRQPPNSYLIPRWDLGPEVGAFIRIQFPGVGSGSGKVSQEDVDTFESILAQCTTFLERATPPKEHARYNPAEYAPGQGYVSSVDMKPGESNGKIVLVDEEDGSVVGELTEGYDIVEKPGVKSGSKNPVEIQLPSEGEGNQISVGNVSEEYLRMAQHPAYRNSTLVQTSAEASRLIVTGSSYLANLLTSGAESFTRKTKPNPKPLSFSETTQSRLRKISSFSHTAADFSAKTAGQVSRYAQNLGANLARRKDLEKQRSYDNKSGRAAEYNKPSILNRSMIAFTTIADGIEQGARNVLLSGSAAASTIVGHRYGPEAGSVARDFTSGFKNVGLVYIDAAGVSRKAVLKSVAKGMVVGRMRDGKQVLVGSGDGGEVPSDVWPSRSPPPAYGASGTVSLSGPTMSGGKR